MTGFHILVYKKRWTQHLQIAFSGFLVINICWSTSLTAFNILEAMLHLHSQIKTIFNNTKKKRTRKTSFISVKYFRISSYTMLSQAERPVRQNSGLKPHFASSCDSVVNRKQLILTLCLLLPSNVYSCFLKNKSKLWSNTGWI